MPTIKLKEEEANNLIKNYLLKHFDCDEKIKFIANRQDQEINYYYVYETVFYHGSYTRKVSLLNFANYKFLLIAALKEKGYDKIYIKPVLRNDLSYEIYFQIYDKIKLRRRIKK